MSDFSDYKLTKKEKTEHEKGVQRIRDSLRRLGLPILPAHIVKCDCYHPDACTRIDKDFIVLEYINSPNEGQRAKGRKGQFCYDLGGLLVLLLHKDIVEKYIAVIGAGVFPELVAKIQKYRSPDHKRLVILFENDLDAYLEERIGKTNLWQPDDIK